MNEEQLFLPRQRSTKKKLEYREKQLQEMRMPFVKMSLEEM